PLHLHLVPAVEGLDVPVAEPEGGHQAEVVGVLLVVLQDGRTSAAQQAGGHVRHQAEGGVEVAGRSHRFGHGQHGLQVAGRPAQPIGQLQLVDAEARLHVIRVGRCLQRIVHAPGPCSPNSRNFSPGSQSPVTWYFVPIAWLRAMTSRPNCSCVGSHFSTARSTSKSAATSASRSFHASSAALAVPAAAWGRAAKAASPRMRVRPYTMRGMVTSMITWMKGWAVLATTSARKSGQASAASALRAST